MTKAMLPGNTRAYYNENDPKAAAWLRELIRQGHIAPGVVDERSITEIQPDDLTSFTQCHFFAGIGGWSYALRLAGWPDSRPVWTGSCPCQPFSAAGLGLGTADSRHLWPAFFGLIEKRFPPVVFGEQVASKAALGWIDGVFDDLEKAGYACGANDLCAAGVGAPHIRQRLFWVADSHASKWRADNPAGDNFHRTDSGRAEGDLQSGTDGETRGLADSDGRNAGQEREQRGREHGQLAQDDGTGGLVYSQQQGLEGQPRDGDDRNESGRIDPQPHRSTAAPSGAGDCRMEHSESDRRIERRPESSGRSVVGRRRPWDSFDLLHCTDGKTRRIEPGTFPLAHGVPCRVGLLRGYGNAINAEIAAAFIESYLELK